MTGERIVRSVLMSAALALGVAGCPPVPPDGGDGGVGGSATGGSGTGGSAGAAASVPVCATVASLPTMGTTCSIEQQEESQCDATGNRCVCERPGIWYCTTMCTTTYPTEPTPDSACMTGATCHYPSGADCQCYNSRWVCTGTSSCPAAANMPMTGQACNGLGVWCDYPNQMPALHMICVCSASADGGWSWTCMQSGVCPTTQPAYDLNVHCTGPAICSYGSTRCKCSPGTGSPWVCGFGSPSFAQWTPSCPGCE